MSLDNLGNKQTIIQHNCEKNNKKNDLVITPRNKDRLHEEDFQNKETHFPNRKQVI